MMNSTSGSRTIRKHCGRRLQFPQKRARRVRRQVRFISRFLNPNSTFLEIGAGDCAVSLEISKSVLRAFATDVSPEAVFDANHADNFEFIVSDGTAIPVPEGSIDVAYSNQVMEHLHPDDAVEQLENIHRSISEGGVYILQHPESVIGSS